MKVNDDTRGNYKVNSEIKHKTAMLKSSPCDYSKVHILVKGTIIMAGAGVDAAHKEQTKEISKVSFKNYAPLTSCISEINNTHVDNAKDLQVVIPMHILAEYRDIYAKTSGSLRQ